MTTNITTAGNRRVTRFTKIITSLILAPFLIAAFVGLGIGIVHAVQGSPSSTVSDFNDGFSDSKRDDCQQGFQPACEWLKTTKQ